MAGSVKDMRSPRWGYFRIIVGTILGGMLGFYAMHRAEAAYKVKFQERLKQYEEELARKSLEEASNELPE